MSINRRSFLGLSLLISSPVQATSNIAPKNVERVIGSAEKTALEEQILSHIEKGDIQSLTKGNSKNSIFSFVHKFWNKFSPEFQKKFGKLLIQSLIARKRIPPQFTEIPEVTECIVLFNMKEDKRVFLIRLKSSMLLSVENARNNYDNELSVSYTGPVSFSEEENNILRQAGVEYDAAAMRLVFPEDCFINFLGDGIISEDIQNTHKSKTGIRELSLINVEKIGIGIQNKTLVISLMFENGKEDTQMYMNIPPKVTII